MVINFIDIIKSSLSQITGLAPEKFHLEIPEKKEHGDYSSNIAMTIFTEVKSQKSKVKTADQNSKVIAEEIVKMLKVDKKLQKFVGKIEVAGQGFINFWLSISIYYDTLRNINLQKDIFGKTELLKGKKILIEHTSPNTIKTLHVGHLRNNVLGMSIHNILEFCGAKVALDSINNDRGIHVMKAVWAYIKYGQGKSPKDAEEKSDHFVDKFYVMGAKASDDKKSKEEMQELLRKWEKGDKEVRRVWKKLRDWTYEGFWETYRKIGSLHDREWFESEFYEKGRKVVLEGLKKGVFRKLSDGAILSNLKDYGLSDTIVLRADGTTMYHTQDLYLAQLKRKEFPSDIYIWDLGKDQILYMKQLYAMLDQLGIGKLADYFHMTFGYIFLKDKGKMSSRSGNVVDIDSLVEEMVNRASKINPEVAEEVGLGAIKYSLLKLSRDKDITFDIDESLSLEGNSGPYLQYTYARCQSVLRKGKEHRAKNIGQENKQLESKTTKKFDQNLTLNDNELSVLRILPHFSETIDLAAKNYSPNLICNYLYKLASAYNNFYNQERILGDKNETFRLELTSGVGQVLKSGLYLLGIKAPQKM